MSEGEGDVLVDFLSAASVDETLEILAAYGDDAVVLAGGSAIMYQLKSGIKSGKVLVHIEKLANLSFVHRDGAPKIGALTSLRKLAESDELADQLLRLVNRARFEVGAVTLDEELTAFAEAYACTMITEDFFGHTHPKTGVGLAERAMAAEYNYLAVGENLAAGIAAPEDVVEAWLGSAAHREIMLDPAFTRTGMAVRYGGENEVYWVQVFADPAD